MLAKTEVLEKLDEAKATIEVSQWEIGVLLQGLALVHREKIYERDPAKGKGILRLAGRLKNAKP